MAAERVSIVGIGDDGVEGMTGQARRLVEAAEVLQIPEGTVKSRVSRARKTLARDLQHLRPGMRSRRAGDGREEVRDD